MQWGHIEGLRCANEPKTPLISPAPHLSPYMLSTQEEHIGAEHCALACLPRCLLSCAGAKLFLIVFLETDSGSHGGGRIIGIPSPYRGFHPTGMSGTCSNMQRMGRWRCRVCQARVRGFIGQCSTPSWHSDSGGATGEQVHHGRDCVEWRCITNKTTFMESEPRQQHSRGLFTMP